MTGAKRAYRLSPEGLAALRASARRVRPWERSTGPRTEAGKARSSRNALKHGLRRARVIAAQRELARAIRVLDAAAAAGQDADIDESAGSIEEWRRRVREEQPAQNASSASRGAPKPPHVRRRKKPPAESRRTGTMIQWMRRTTLA